MENIGIRSILLGNWQGGFWGFQVEGQIGRYIVVNVMIM